MNVAGYLDRPSLRRRGGVRPARGQGAARWPPSGACRPSTRALDELLADSDVDAVEVLTPTHLHKEHVLAAVAAGKHVSCQKPIANSVADGVEMTEAARPGRGRLPGQRVLLPLPAAHEGQGADRGGCDRPADDAPRQDRRRVDRHRVPEPSRAAGLRVEVQRPEPGRASLRRHRPQVRHRAVALRSGHHQRPGRRAPSPAVLRGTHRGDLGVRARDAARHDGSHVRAAHVVAQPLLRRRRVLRDPGHRRVHLGDPRDRRDARPATRRPLPPGRHDDRATPTSTPTGAPGSSTRHATSSTR